MRECIDEFERCRERGPDFLPFQKDSPTNQLPAALSALCFLRSA